MWTADTSCQGMDNLLEDDDKHKSLCLCCTCLAEAQMAWLQSIPITSSISRFTLSTSAPVDVIHVVTVHVLLHE